MHDYEQIITRKLLKLIEILRLDRNFSKDDINNLFYKPAEPHFQEKKLVHEIIQEVQKRNPQLSNDTIFTELIPKAIYLFVIKRISLSSDQDIIEYFLPIINNLINFKSTQCIDIPLSYLEVGTIPIQLGWVTYRRINESDKDNEWWKAITRICPDHELPNVKSFAKVYTIGDRLTSLNFAEEKLRENLQIIRAIGFPFRNDDVGQFGILGEFSAFSTFPIRCHKPEENTSFEYRTGVTLRIGNAFRVLDLTKHIMNNIEGEIINGIDRMLKKEEKDLSPYEKKFLQGLKWLGEATKPDTVDARIVKLSIALEFFIGGESSNQYLTTRGITASIAERAAFLCSDIPESRRDMDKKIRHYYSIRSGIVHGTKSKNINLLEEFVEYGNTVRKLALSLLPKLNEYVTIDNLQEWVHDQRYS